MLWKNEGRVLGQGPLETSAAGDAGKNHCRLRKVFTDEPEATKEEKREKKIPYDQSLANTSVSRGGCSNGINEANSGSKKRGLSKGFWKYAKKKDE